MGDELTIREAGPDDLAALMALYQHLNPGDPETDPAEGRRILAQISAYPGSAVLLGLAGDEIATSCTLIVVPNLTRGGAAYGLIENVVTAPRFRKRGFGKAVLRAAVARAWRHDCYKAMLLTGVKNPATLAFYAEAGFEQSKTGFQARRIPAREEAAVEP